ncbi:MAG: hypothetical protein JNL74_07865 [Fibrobacteres bacterium]|nr:hypothetical protein [Fibrobacterota bacterium]
MHNRTEIVSMINSIADNSFKAPMLAFCEKNLKTVMTMPGAISHHHNWEGGWADHTAQVMGIGISLYDQFKDGIGDSFNRDDVIVVGFCHDLDKLTRYKQAESEWAKQKGYKWEFNKDNAPYEETSKAIVDCLRNGIMLTDEHVEAINHHHGGFSSDISSVYHGSGRMTSLSTLLHCADMLSAYLFGRKQPTKEELENATA